MALYLSLSGLLRKTEVGSGAYKALTDVVSETERVFRNLVGHCHCIY